MSMDGLSLLAVSTELSALIGGKVDKIQQPERDTLILTIRAGGSNYRLLLCAHPENGRVQLTETNYPNPPEPPAFCMLLRKRLTGGRIHSVEQPSLDRVLVMEIEARDELGDTVLLKLVTEVMGKHSNICFLSQNDAILDCVRHVGAGMSSVRMLLPGIIYTPPPPQVKLNPLLSDEEDFYCALEGRGAVHKLLSGKFFGLSPDCARQMASRWSGEADLDSQALSDTDRRAFARFVYRLYRSFLERQFFPTIVYNDLKEPVAVYAFTPACAPQSCVQASTMSAALDAFYAERDKLERFRRKSGSAQRILQNHLERCYKRLAVAEQALNQDENLELLRLSGELILANAHSLSRGMQAARLMNYYLDPPAESMVELDERLSPQENAQRYFKRYQKGKAAKALAAEQKEKALEEIAYLEGQQDNLDKCATDEELAEIREELVREGYLKPENSRVKPQKHAPSKPLSLRSSDGFEIYIGRNNQQNDALTLRFARPEDWWLHTKNIPGSHVIVRGDGELPETTLREAAMLAAYYSKARASASVPVDYCMRKYVKKPAGARPGMVIYTTNRTVYVTPDEAAVKRLESGETVS
jgi:predicted ribosome quality control (RQC) complex YloA/Tae2 family protein